MNRNDIIDVLTAVAAGDRRTVGQADVDMWSAVVSDDTRVTKDEALVAVVEHFRECPGVWLEPGHVVQRVRAARRDRLEREPDEMREARQKALEAKVAEDIAELAESKGLGDVTFQRPGRDSPLTVKCPWCRADVGDRCVIPHTQPEQKMRRFHPSRKELVQKELQQ
jgi:hypothetical protein